MNHQAWNYHKFVKIYFPEELRVSYQDSMPPPPPRSSLPIKTSRPSSRWKFKKYFECIIRSIWMKVYKIFVMQELCGSRQSVLSQQDQNTAPQTTRSTSSGQNIFIIQQAASDWLHAEHLQDVIRQDDRQQQVTGETWPWPVLQQWQWTGWYWRQTQGATEDCQEKQLSDET